MLISGTDASDRRVVLLQHVSQMNLLLIAAQLERGEANGRFRFSLPHIWLIEAVQKAAGL